MAGGGATGGRARRGVTLVELMVSMLILTVVCLAWLEIVGVQSARREARRREAVERLAGMMDAFLYEKRSGGVGTGGYRMEMHAASGTLAFHPDAGTNTVHALFDPAVSPVGYQLCVVTQAGLPADARPTGWAAAHRWLVGRLYDGNGPVREVGRPFFTLPVCLGF